MIKILLLFICFFKFLESKSATNIKNILENEHSPIAHSILKSASSDNKTQDATPRPSTPPLPIKNIDINSPSSGIVAMEKEREALYPFMKYLHDRIPTDSDQKLTRTPLNRCSILRSALKDLNVGDNLHFRSHILFSHSSLSQLVLQTDVEVEEMDKDGRTNLERMKNGSAPLGPDKEPINLHHINQEDGLLAEITSRTHQKYYGTLHTRLKDSHINRAQFNNWRKAYWRHRAETLSSSVPKNLFGSASPLPIQKTIPLKKKK